MPKYYFFVVICVFSLLPLQLSLATDSVVLKGGKQSNGKVVSEPYSKILFVGVEGELLENIKRNVRLVSRLNSKDALSNSERSRLQSRVLNEVKAALEPFGYYQVVVRRELSVDAKILVYQVELNQPVLLKTLDIELSDNAKQQAEFSDWLTLYPLTEGQILNQPKYESAKKSLLSQALRLGYYDARFSQSDIIINEQRTSADIVLKFVSGKRYTIGEIVFDWQFEQLSDDRAKRRIEDDLLNSLINIKSGEYVNTDDLNSTQRSLLAAPYFANVDVQAKDPDIETQTVVINIALTPRKPASYSVELGAGSDTGVRGGIGYENRQVNKRGHNLSLRLGGSQIRRSANANYRIPLPKKESGSLDFFASLEEENGDVRDFTNTTLGTQLSISAGSSFLQYRLVASRERSSNAVADEFDIDGSPLVEQQTTNLLLPSFSWQRSKKDDLYFPTKGWAGEFTVRGASQDLGSDIDLAQAIVEANALYPALNGRLKLRFMLAASAIDEADDLPESLGFLAGGDDSVRGYRFESIGALRNGEVSVAKNLVVGSVEYQHSIKNNFALASFFDVGDAFDSDLDLQRGLGVGVRWRLPFGALRLDVASALDLDGTPLRLHFGFGTDL